MDKKKNSVNNDRCKKSAWSRISVGVGDSVLVTSLSSVINDCGDDNLKAKNQILSYHLIDILVR